VFWLFDKCCAEKGRLFGRPGLVLAQGVRSTIVRIGWGFRVSIIGLARIPAVRASSLMVATFVIVVSSVVLGGSWASMIKSL
jgi:hypothetical protein